MNSSAHQPTEDRPGRRSPRWLACSASRCSPSCPAQETAPTAGPAAASSLVFYPPVPRFPPLGSPIPSASDRSADPKPAAPGAMAAYVDEPFYAPLAGPAWSGKQPGRRALLSPRELSLHEKTALLAELQARLYTLRDADPATRASALADFAREQTPQVAELEKNAERSSATICFWGSLVRHRALGGPADAKALNSPGVRPRARPGAGGRPDCPLLWRGTVAGPAPPPAGSRDRAGRSRKFDSFRRRSPATSLMFFSLETARIRLPVPLAARAGFAGRRVPPGEIRPQDRAAGRPAGLGRDAGRPHPPRGAAEPGRRPSAPFTALESLADDHSARARPRSKTRRFRRPCRSFRPNSPRASPPITPKNSPCKGRSSSASPPSVGSASPAPAASAWWQSGSG